MQARLWPSRPQNNSVRFFIVDGKELLIDFTDSLNNDHHGCFTCVCLGECTADTKCKVSTARERLHLETSFITDLSKEEIEYLSSRWLSFCKRLTQDMDSNIVKVQELIGEVKQQSKLMDNKIPVKET